MLNRYVNFNFSILKKLLDLPHKKLVDIPGGHGVGIDIHGCQPTLEMPIYVLKTRINPDIYTGSVCALKFGLTHLHPDLFFR